MTQKPPSCRTVTPVESREKAAMSGFAVAVGTDVGVGRSVTVGVAGTGVGTGVAVGTSVAVGAWTGVGAGACVAVGAGMAVAVLVGGAVVGVGIGVGCGVAVGVAAGDGMLVGMAAAVAARRAEIVAASETSIVAAIFGVGVGVGLGSAFAIAAWTVASVSAVGGSVANACVGGCAGAHRTASRQTVNTIHAAAIRLIGHPIRKRDPETIARIYHHLLSDDEDRMVVLNRAVNGHRLSVSALSS